MALTDRQAQFCREYLIDLSATHAAVRAGYSKKTANRIGPKLLNKPAVAAEVERLKAAREERTDLSADWVIRRLQQEAQGLGRTSSHSARVRALELLGKHLGLFKDKLEVTGKDGGPIQLTAEQRAEAVAAILSKAAARLPSAPPDPPPADPAG